MHKTASHGRSQRQWDGPPRDKSVRALNLTRLSKRLDIDFLAVALRLREESLKAMIQGREPVLDAQAQSIEFHLMDAGFDPGWLDQREAPIPGAQIRELKELGATSREKAPVRRANLNLIAGHFTNDMYTLADSLEIVHDSLLNIIAGTVKFDEYRMGHLNPILMRAGFPDNWLEEPNPELKPEWIESLRRLAYEDEELVEPVITKEDVAPKLTPDVRMGPVSIAFQPKVPRTVAPVTPDSLSTIGDPMSPAQDQNVNLIPPTPSVVVKKPGRPRRVDSGTPAIVPAVAMHAGLPTSGVGVPRGAMGVSRPMRIVESQQPQVVMAGAAQKTSPEKERSMRRVEALNAFLKDARRGAKKFLWDDLLGKGQAYWGNIKSGAINFKDSLADQITDALELPRGWLDNPVTPVKSAAWIFDNNVPLAQSAVKVKPEESPVKPQEVLAPPALEQQEVIPSVSAEVAAPSSAPDMPRPGVEVPPMLTTNAARLRGIAGASKPASSPEVKPSAPTVAAPKVIEHALSNQALLENGFTWAPSVEHTQSAVGPIAQALTAQLTKLTLAGKFTENDAVRLLYYLMSR